MHGAMLTFPNQLFLSILNSTAVGAIENVRDDLWQNIQEPCCVFDL